MNRKTASDETAQLLRVVTAVVFVAALYVGRTVFIPLALALLLSLLLTPVMEFLRKIRVPRLLSVLIVVVALCGLGGGLVWKASAEFTDLANQIPIYRETLASKDQDCKCFAKFEFQQSLDRGERPGERARYSSCRAV